MFGLDRIETLELLGNNYNFIERDAMKMGREAIKLLINRMAFPDRPKNGSGFWDTKTNYQ